MKHSVNTGLFVALVQSAILVFFVSASTSHSKEYSIGVEDVSYFPLYDFSPQYPNRASFTKELLSSFFNSKGYQYKFVPLPIKRFDKWYVEEAIDFKFPDNVRWRMGESKKLSITYSTPVLTLTAGTYVIKEKAEQPRDYVKRLGTILGFFPTLWYDKIQDNSTALVELSSPYSIIKHMLHGNVDATNIDKNVINYNLQLLGQSRERIVLNKQIKNEQYAYHFSSISYPRIIEEFNHFLVENQQLIARIKLKYGIIEANKKNSHTK